MIYLDNAATTLKKPKNVINAVNDCMKNYCANSGRGGHTLSLRASEEIYDCRQELATLFNIKNPLNIIFTSNTTMALNIAIQGLGLQQNDHVIISETEHNSVSRIIHELKIPYSVAKADDNGFISAKSIEKEICNNTKLIVLSHASNITGTIQPIKEVGKIAKKNNITFLVDAAQTAGVCDIDVIRDNIDMLAFAGHKMLFGPTGTGGLYLSPSITLNPILFGGTGSLSLELDQPLFLPDMLESGTLNTVGICGLKAGVKFIRKTGIRTISEYENNLTDKMYEAFSNMKNIKVYGNKKRTGIVSISLGNSDSVIISDILNNDYNIAIRGGFHCASLAHHALKTDRHGLIRFSVSYFNTEKEIKKAINAVNKISKNLF